MHTSIIILLAVTGMVLYLIVIYNRLVSLRVGINAAWSDIDVQLKRRHDLVPALVETIKGYKAYEQETLEKIVKAREAGLDAKSVEEKAKAATLLSGALGRLFARSEDYPDLKANTTFLKLQSELSDLENATQNARRYYNAITRDYNAKIQSFPDLFVARKFDFTKRAYFELNEAEADRVKTMPKVSF